MGSPTDRKNQLVWDAIDGNSPKQALQLCNKRIKKGEKGDYLMVLKSHVLTILGSPANLEEALGICKSIARKQPPPDDIEVLNFLQRVWSHLDQNFPQGRPIGASKAEMAKLWESAVKKKLGDEKLAKEWFWASVKTGEWKGAQKAALNLQKQFPKKREYYFWAIMSCSLLHNSLPETSPERKVFGTLAYRMIVKAKDEVPPEAENLVLPPRAIHTAEDVHLLLSIISSASPAQTPMIRSQEALAILDSPNVGVNSKIGKGDWLRLIRRKVTLLKEVSDWKALWELCEGLLHKAQDQGNASEPGIGDDWLLWEGLLQSLRGLTLPGYEGESPYGLRKQELKEKCLEVIKGCLSCGSGAGTRNSDLAMVKFASLFHGEDAVPEPPDGINSLFEACQSYFVKVGSKSCCFEDLHQYIESFSDHEKEKFLEYLKSLQHGQEIANGQDELSPKKITSLINIQKFIYLLEISPLPTAAFSSPPTENGSHKRGAETPIVSDFDLDNPIVSAFVNKLLSFATSSLEVYALSVTSPLSTSLLPTDNQHGDDATLLAVMSLVRLWKFTQKDKYLFLSVHVLETLLTKSRHNYQALLLLTRLYLLLGAPYLAASSECWGRLNIKQIQYDTLGHWLLTRGSTIFPFPPPGALHPNSDVDVVASLRKSLGIYHSSRRQTPEMCVLAFEKGSYGQIEEFVRFGERVEGSICRGMWEIEKRRAVRLRGNSCDVFTGNNEPWGVEMLGTETGKLYDNRDYGVLISCESKGKSFEELISLGDIPQQIWVKCFSLVESFLSSFTANSQPPRDLPTPPTSKQLTDLLCDPSTNQELTPQERSYLTLFSYLANLVETLNSSTSKEALKEPLESIKSWFTTTSSSLSSNSFLQNSHDNFQWNHSTLHMYYLALEACTVLSLILSTVVSSSGPSGPISSLQQQLHKSLKSSVLKQIHGDILSYTQALAKKVRSSAEEMDKSLNKVSATDLDREGNEFEIFLFEKEKGKEVFGGLEGYFKTVQKIRGGQREAIEGVKQWKRY